MNDYQNVFTNGLGAPAASVFSLVLCLIFFATGRWKTMTIIRDRKVREDD